MQLNNDIMKAVETLDYRVTVGDVAAQSGLELSQAQSGLLALASETQAHLQVAESGDVAYEFSKNFRTILRNKYWQIRFQETWAKVWQVLFYLIRLSFGAILIASLVIIVVAITILVIAMQQQQSNDRDNRGGGGGLRINPFIWFSGWHRWFGYGYGGRRYSGGYRGGYGGGGYGGGRNQRSTRTTSRSDDDLNFFEAIFSFLFGDGDPNADIEDRRWNAIATVIRNQRGAVTAEQITPYLDDLGKDTGFEDYMIPVLSRFNGQPKVSPEGDIVYYFPELQVTAKSHKRQSVAAYLKEAQRKFSVASSGQIMLAIGLGSANFIGAIVLYSLLQDGSLAAQMGGFIGFVQGIIGLLIAYGTAFLGIPLGRFLWLKGHNQGIESRNQQRQDQAIALNQLEQGKNSKLLYAQKFANETIVSKEDLIYTTETDLIDQEQAQKERLDAEWLKRLEDSNSE